jgi:monomeric sarcosine oxidase
MSNHDVIVLGLGGVGSATAYALAKRGYRVLGLDQFSPPHALGSSHGETRIIRQAYFEHPGYVPMLIRAYALWRELEQEVNQTLYHRTGIIEIGPPDGLIIPGVRASAAAFELPIELMSMKTAESRYPMIRGDESWSVILEQDAGYLLVEECVAAHIRRAKELGAHLRMNQRVVNWRATKQGVVVNTTEAEYSANRLVIAAGPWVTSWLQSYNIRLQVLHKHLYWYETDTDSYTQASGFPCFFFETTAGCYYGFPQRDAWGLKVAQHSGGRPVSTTINGRHDQDPQDRRAVEDFLLKFLPGTSLRLTRASGCYYTMTPDEHFIIDTLPDHPQVTVIAGLSGHGFKFTSVLGEIAAMRATDTACPLELGFLELKRFQLHA